MISMRKRSSQDSSASASPRILMEDTREETFLTRFLAPASSEIHLHAAIQRQNPDARRTAQVAQIYCQISTQGARLCSTLG